MRYTEDKIAEEWRDIPEYEGKYQVSNLGRVKSLERQSFNGYCMIRQKGRILSKTPDAKGRHRVNLCKNGKRKGKTVAQLVAICFLGHVPNGHEIVVDHIDNNPSNDRLENLQLITNRQNCSKDKTKKYVGVFYSAKYNTYRARITIGRERVSLGSYPTEIEAHNAYQNKLKEIENNGK